MRKLSMQKKMYPVAVATNDDGDIVITQEVGDMNYPDPEVRISKEQANLVCSWIQQASTKGDEKPESEVRPVSATLHTDQRGSELESIEVYVNAVGMVALKINDVTSLEISPTMAKRLREQLSRAITESLTDLLRPDAEA